MKGKLALPLLAALAALVAALITAGPAASASWRASANNIITWNDTLAIPRPVAIQPGDLVLAVIASRLDVPVDVPTGWTLIRTDTNPVYGVRYAQRALYRIADAGEPSSYTFTFSEDVSAIGVISAYSGIDTSNPIIASSGRYDYQAGTAAMTAPGIALGEQAMLVAAFGHNGRRLVNPPAGCVERQDRFSSLWSSYWQGIELCDRYVQIGATGDYVALDADATALAFAAGQLIALRPVAEAPQEPSSPAGSWRASANNISTWSTQLTITRPAAIQPGDLVLAVIASRPDVPVEIPYGWALVRTDTNPGYGVRFVQRVLYRIARPGEPGSYAFTFGEAVSAIGVVSAYSGIDTTSPIITSSGRYDYQGGTAAMTAPGLELEEPAMLVAAFAHNGRRLANPPSGCAEREDRFSSLWSSYWKGVELCDRLVTVGATGDYVALDVNGTVLTFAAGQLVALRPVSSGPTNTSPPHLTGVPVESETLYSSAGNWTGGAYQYDYQWQRCNTAGSNCVNIDSPDASDDNDYTLTPADVGSRVRCVVIATNAEGSTPAPTAVSSTIEARIPTALSDPLLSGTLSVGSQLSVDPGSWEGTQPISFIYEWHRCDEWGANCTTVTTGTETAYQLVAADAGAIMRVIVNATNIGGNASTAAETPTTISP